MDNDLPPNMNQQQPRGQESSPQPGFSNNPNQKYSINAILSLIFAFVFWPAGLVLGIVAIAQIKNNPNLKGKGLAIAGIIVSSLGVLLVLFVMLGSLAYFGVLSPDNFLPPRCQFSAGLDCTETATIDKGAGTISFLLTNTMGYDLHNMSVMSSTCPSGSLSKDPVKDRESMMVILTGCDFSQERYNEDITLTYTSAKSGMKHKMNGIVSGSLQ